MGQCQFLNPCDMIPVLRYIPYFLDPETGLKALLSTDVVLAVVVIRFSIS